MMDASIWQLSVMNASILSVVCDGCFYFVSNLADTFLSVICDGCFYFVCCL